MFISAITPTNSRATNMTHNAYGNANTHGKVRPGEGKGRSSHVCTEAAQCFPEKSQGVEGGLDMALVKPLLFQAQFLQLKSEAERDHSFLPWRLRRTILGLWLFVNFINSDTAQN